MDIHSQDRVVELPQFISLLDYHRWETGYILQAVLWAPGKLPVSYVLTGNLPVI